MLSQTRYGRAHKAEKAMMIANVSFRQRMAVSPWQGKQILLVLEITTIG